MPKSEREKHERQGKYTRKEMKQAIGFFLKIGDTSVIDPSLKNPIKFRNLTIIQTAFAVNWMEISIRVE